MQQSAGRAHAESENLFAFDANLRTFELTVRWRTRRVREESIMEPQASSESPNKTKQTNRRFVLAAAAAAANEQHPRRAVLHLRQAQTRASRATKGEIYMRSKKSTSKRSIDSKPVATNRTKRNESNGDQSQTEVKQTNRRKEIISSRRDVQMGPNRASAD